MYAFTAFMLIAYTSAAALVTDGDSEDDDRWIARFNAEAAQVFLRSLAAGRKDEIVYDQTKRSRRDEITLYPDHPVVRTDVNLIQSTDEMKHMMFALFKKDGMFRSEGYYCSGEISIDGYAEIMTSKLFANKSAMLKDLREAETAPIESSVFAVLTRMLFLPKDIKKLEDSLVKCIEKGDEEAHERSAPRIVIYYGCCDKSTQKNLAPEFGAIQMAMN